MSGLPKNYSPKVAEKAGLSLVTEYGRSERNQVLLRKGPMIWFQNQDLTISSASLAALREMPFDPENLFGVAMGLTRQAPVDSRKRPFFSQ